MSRNEKDAMRESLMSAMDASYAHKDDTGKFASVFQEGIKTWKCGEGDHEVDIIPYYVGEHHPTRKPPDWDYVLDIWVHYGVGVNEDAFLCMAKTYKQRCAVCDYQKKLRDLEGVDEDLIKSLNPKRRSIYNIVCLDNSKELDKGIQVWDSSHYLMERLLVPLTRTKHGDKIYFCDPEGGKSVAFTREGSREKTSFIGHRLQDRTEQYDFEVVKQSFVLDDIIKQPAYKEIFEYLDDGGVQSQDAVADEPKTAGRSLNGLRKPLGKDKDDADIDAATELPPRSAAPATSTDGECPAGYEFGGDDWDNQPECAKCEIWSDCAKAFKERDKGASKTPTRAAAKSPDKEDGALKKRSFASKSKDTKEKPKELPRRSLRRS